MRFDLLHPADQLVLMMDRIYQNGLTTLAGGNLSVLDESGDIWITPSGVDKGMLTRGDMCRVRPDGAVEGPHAPSVELPFHASIYRKRPDLRAVLHAHPPELVAFSLARVLPAINLTPSIRETLGAVAMAEYAVPGSELLGRRLAAKFEKGYDVVVMENHGAVVGADSLLAAFQRFETLESCACMELHARKLGGVITLEEAEISLSLTREHLAMDSFVPESHSSEERAARRDMITFIRRACRRSLFGSAQGDCSLRLSDGSFLITPSGFDRAYMEEADLVLIRDGKKEQGKTPARSVRLHRSIYDRRRSIRSIFSAAPPHVMAFAVTDAGFDPRTIPESYIQLRDTRKIPYRQLYLEPETVADMLSAKTPVLLCENDRILATGASLRDAFGCLEAAEATAHSILSARDVAPIVRISDGEIQEINAAFHLE